MLAVVTAAHATRNPLGWHLLLAWMRATTSPMIATFWCCFWFCLLLFCAVCSEQGRLQNNLQFGWYVGMWWNSIDFVWWWESTRTTKVYKTSFSPSVLLVSLKTKKPFSFQLKTQILNFTDRNGLAGYFFIQNLNNKNWWMETVSWPVSSVDLPLGFFRFYCF
jgi:hypothetical protein